MSVQRLPLEKQATPRNNSSKPIQQISSTARTITKPPLVQQEMNPDNTILSFMKSLDGKQAGILNRSIRDGEKLHKPLIKPRTYIAQQKTIPTSNVERQILNNLETRIQKLPQYEQELVLQILASIENGQPKHEELISFFKSKRIHLKIHSNYGNKTQVGLTSIELFNNNRKYVKINCIYSDDDSHKTINNLINGHNLTIYPEQMWITNFKQFPITITICYLLQEESEFLTSVKIWNFNKNRKELDKCVCELEILQNDQILWSGQIARGVANTFSEYAQTIELESQPQQIINTIKENEIRINKNQNDSTQPFNQSSQSINSKKSDENKEINLSKASSQQKHAKPKLIFDPFDDDKKFKKFEQKQEPSSVKTKQTIHQQRFFKKSINLFSQKQLTEDDSTSPQLNFKRGVAHIAAGTISTRTKNISIPECPFGSKLIIKFLKNWGDLYSIGLTGIEIFDYNGKKVKINSVSGFFRNAAVLFDDNYLTQDDKNMCIERIDKSMEITIKFNETKLSMIRIWNYNKGRTYRAKCVRNIEIVLDTDSIFSGEIKQANGTCGIDNAEYIMFTNNPQIMEKIQEQDWLNKLHESQIQQQKHILENTVKLSRPDTATFNKPKGEITAQKFANNNLNSQFNKDYQHQKSDSIPQIIRQESESKLQQHPKRLFSSQNQINVKTLPTVNIKVLTLYLIRNWGDKFIGLDKIDIHDKFGQSMKIKKYKVITSQSETVVNSDERWQLNNGKIKIQFVFIQPTQISRVAIWNYNKEDELEKGVQMINIKGDNQILNTKQGIYLRKGHGLSDVNEPQLIELPYQKRIDTVMVNYQFERNIYQDYETTQLPQGTKLVIKLLSTWGDLHYIGLNGIEIFDPNGEQLYPKLFAKPFSVKELPQMEMDVRTPDKLLNNVNITLDAKQMWLSPFVNSYTDRLKTNINSSIFDQISYQVNKLILLFDTPQQISAISFYNYSKTPVRGVKECEISIDDNIMYQGYLNLSTLTQTVRGIMGNNKTTVLFTRDERLIDQIGTVEIRESIIGSETLLINENQKLKYNSIKNKEVRLQQQGLYKELDRPTTTQVY
ncbi:unnamed protein product [Paramecium pentaurelia]|uniref:KATNIP domain-containing protein n=1 Tax=Paramecium pentaurelia TaxID=43138 RepID=A0A8S1W5I7_9CILI|nr:unnamed protein product [Paramecium pentaurelia]